uniref:(northern house mosquito) hypothetical protein n=1 Tax=Culex pipiens TaxID=7175 RepID=A0A8D8KBH8_CULPI
MYIFLSQLSLSHCVVFTFVNNNPTRRTVHPTYEHQVCCFHPRNRFYCVCPPKNWLFQMNSHTLQENRRVESFSVVSAVWGEEKHLFLDTSRDCCTLSSSLFSKGLVIADGFRNRECGHLFALFLGTL